ncbi:MAG: hypothetical protein K6F35_04630 [Lachnospiraceae bacterium]|nr:hypothetical protein [Lachnospiraceae bacterium]
MSVTEILLLIIGAVIFAAGFIVPEMKSKQGGPPDPGHLGEDLKAMTEKTLEDARRRLNDIVTMECGVAEDDAKREMERATNDKMMAINEYGKTVLDEIERNHKEVMFLYDMLNEKSADIKNTVRKVDSVNRQAMEQKAEEKKESMPEEKKEAAQPSGKQQERSIKIPKIFAPKTAESGAVDGEEKQNEPQKAASQSRVHKKILELSESGMSDKEIAKELGIGVGEVRLKIDLSRQEGMKHEA